MADYYDDWQGEVDAGIHGPKAENFGPYDIPTLRGNLSQDRYKQYWT